MRKRDPLRDHHLLERTGRPLYRGSTGTPRLHGRWQNIRRVHETSAECHARVDRLRPGTRQADTRTNGRADVCVIPFRRSAMTELEKSRLFKRARYWRCDSVFDRVIERDRTCIYCGLEFEPSNWAKASIEHIDNDVRNVDPINIAICCRSCNSSKGSSELNAWLRNVSKLVKEKHIDRNLVEWVREEWCK